MKNTHQMIDTNKQNLSNNAKQAILLHKVARPNKAREKAGHQNQIIGIEYHNQKGGSRIIDQEYRKNNILWYQLSFCHNLACVFRWWNRTDMSRFPPLTIQHTLFPLNLPSLRTAATTVAEDGSTTIFIRSSTSCVASMISSSLTRMISSLFRCYLRILKVSGPKLVLRPSAIDIGGNCPTISPFSIDIFASRARYGSTPMGLHFPPKYLVLSTHPLLSPPPPMGKTRQSRSLRSSKTSLAAVACPAMISRSLQGCTNQDPYCLVTLSAVSSRSLRVLPDSITFPPYPMTPFFLTVGELAGMTMQEGMPRVVAAYARACAWFPEECVHTEVTFLSSWSSLLKAPLALNAPTFCKFSHLRQNSVQPALEAIV